MKQKYEHFEWWPCFHEKRSARVQVLLKALQYLNYQCGMIEREHRGDSEEQGGETMGQGDS